MNVQVLVQGYHKLPYRKDFRVVEPRQLLILTGSVYWSIFGENIEGLHEPTRLGLTVLIDGQTVPGGDAMIGKTPEGRFATVVPAFIPLNLDARDHSLELKNWHVLPDAPNVSYGTTHFYSIALLEFS